MTNTDIRASWADASLLMLTGITDPEGARLALKQIATDPAELQRLALCAVEIGTLLVRTEIDELGGEGPALSLLAKMARGVPGPSVD